MRSGMRSWSKWKIFSRRTKSSSSVGPRVPRRRLFWLSEIRVPWLVVRYAVGVGLPPAPADAFRRRPRAGLSGFWTSRTASLREYAPLGRPRNGDGLCNRGGAAHAFHRTRGGRRRRRSSSCPRAGDCSRAMRSRSQVAASSLVGRTTTLTRRWHLLTPPDAMTGQPMRSSSRRRVGDRHPLASARPEEGSEASLNVGHLEVADRAGLALDVAVRVEPDLLVAEAGADVVRRVT